MPPKSIAPHSKPKINQPEGLRDVPTFETFEDGEFEEMIVDLLLEENPRGRVRRLGPGPIRQQGYDILATLDDGTKVCCECKHRKGILGAKQLTEAAEKFLGGTDVSLAQHFWIVTSGRYSRRFESAERRVSDDCERLRLGFTCVWRNDLWNRLRNHPRVVKKYLGDYWWEQSLKWCQASLLESQERDRRNTEARISSGEMEEGFDDGYLHLTFLLPTFNQRGISGLITFKTDGLERAMITLGNDDVLRAFDEPLWSNNKPFLAAEHAGRAWAQIGNVRTELNQEMFSKLAHNLRAVRERWLNKVQELDRNIEAEGYQFLDRDRIKLGMIRADMWRLMVCFANEHDCEDGESKWHIFDSSPALVKVFTETSGTDMDRGYHLILSTSPHITGHTGDSETVDLIWNIPFEVSRGSSARGKRGAWGCDTAVTWLNEQLIPLLIDLNWPQRRSERLVDKLFRLSPRARTRDVSEFFLVRKATDCLSCPILDTRSLRENLSRLQSHYHSRRDAQYPSTHAEAVDRALAMVFKVSSVTDWNYFADKADLGPAKSKEDLLDRLQERLNASYLPPSGFMLDLRLRALLAAAKGLGEASLNKAEYQMLAEVLSPLAASVNLYNRLLAHRTVPSEIYPV